MDSTETPGILQFYHECDQPPPPPPRPPPRHVPLVVGSLRTEVMSPNVGHIKDIRLAVLSPYRPTQLSCRVPYSYKSDLYDR